MQLTNNEKITICWISESLLFAAFLAHNYSYDTAITYLTVYGIEKALSFDNLLMFYVIFKYFNLSERLQQRALTIGLISSFILRAALIFPCSLALNKFSWLNYLFAAFIAYSGVMLFKGSQDDEREPKKLIAFIKQHWPKLSILGLAIGVIEITDLMFALDSIPASFLITNNPLIIYSANIFAILGLRSMYFSIAKLINKFAWMEKLIASILIFIGLRGLLWVS